ncbi:hypothetical protein GM418_05580 [Maribellus comscasis]|uniref:Uncharacterized protein n=1 Tax=Maribellus comscasis TaxID=2681766 RepID=A0A6I6JJY2_9BACT|nr:hypothetical protein [Maribellus comscasis]QGY43146.1 hypothetical protein GM418_05580 [Maribellus comscasis]
MKKWGIAILIIILVGLLYFIEFSKIQSGNESSGAMPTLDDLTFNEADQNWEYFYRVRANIVDGENAEFSIPKELLESQGKRMELTGAAVFFSPGCRAVENKIAVHTFFLYPTLGLANACVHLPEVAMRWTIRINLKEEWLVTRTDMIQAVVKVRGTFRIDTRKPYESAFFFDEAEVEFVSEEEVGL